MRAIECGLVAATLLLASACSSSTGLITPSADVTTAQPVWPRYFILEWSVAPEVGGTNRLTGYVYNTYGAYADYVQILAQALDFSGSVVGQRVVSLAERVPPRNRSFFSVEGLPPAFKYRATVWNFEFRDRR